MTEETKSDNNQTNTCKDTVCYCSKFFTKANLSKLILGLAIIFFSYFVYNKTDEWLTFYKIEKIAKNMVLEVDPFGDMYINYPGRFPTPENIDNKMLLSALVKQQAEIIRHQKCIEERLAKLLGTTSSNPTKEIEDTKATSTNQQTNNPIEKQSLPGNQPEQPKASGQQLPQGQPIKNN